jgi:DNA (cytosine-5)-methyltransferase 1
VRLLDLFCGGGGAAMGYRLAGFEVVGVDLAPQPRYPFEFIQADAFEVSHLLGSFNAVHASPPCQRFTNLAKQKSTWPSHPDLIGPTRRLLQASGLPYVIENVVGAPLLDPVMYCGSSFGLDVRRHRLFECNVELFPPPCDHGWQLPRFRSLDLQMWKRGKLASVVGVHGSLNYAGELVLRQKAMGINWLGNRALVQAIPPAYTEHIGRQILAAI